MKFELRAKRLLNRGLHLEKAAGQFDVDLLNE
jgi:hypothetical protein